jgi:PDZ domain-containing secreted protein
MYAYLAAGCISGVVSAEYMLWLWCQPAQGEGGRFKTLRQRGAKQQPTGNTSWRTHSQVSAMRKGVLFRWFRTVRELTNKQTNKTKQNKTKQNKTKQNKTKQTNKQNKLITFALKRCDRNQSIKIPRC